MLILGEPGDSLLLKVERAKKHVADLEEEYLRFRQTKPYPYTFSLKTDPKTKEHVYYLSTATAIPKEFSLFVGDALNNLRSALDHAAHELVRIGKCCPDGSFSYAKFPIFSCLSEYNSKSGEAIKGMRQDAINAINAVEPYGGGAGEYFWHLARLNNIDKHRLLLTVWGKLQGHSALRSDRETLARFFRKDESEFKGHFMAVANPTFPLNVGDEVCRVPETEFEDDMRFLLNIAFAEPDIAKGNPVIETLHEMTVIVRHLIFEFDKNGLFR